MLDESLELGSLTRKSLNHFSEHETFESILQGREDVIGEVIEKVRFAVIEEFTLSKRGFFLTRDTQNKTIPEHEDSPLYLVFKLSLVFIS